MVNAWLTCNDSPIILIMLIVKCCGVWNSYMWWDFNLDCFNFLIIFTNTNSMLLISLLRQIAVAEFIPQYRIMNVQNIGNSLFYDNFISKGIALLPLLYLRLDLF